MDRPKVVKVAKNLIDNTSMISEEIENDLEKRLFSTGSSTIKLKDGSLYNLVRNVSYITQTENSKEDYPVLYHEYQKQ